ncbi:hypothetical protein [Corynebacterium stationis]|nr:hypothetical protein [Corynebacterium stationis]HJG63479.1 hypothetical protein [Corynebacterium stationis]
MNYLHPDAQAFLDSTRDAPQLDTQTPEKTGRTNYEQVARGGQRRN